MSCMYSMKSVNCEFVLEEAENTVCLDLALSYTQVSYTQVCVAQQKCVHSSIIHSGPKPEISHLSTVKGMNYDVFLQ